MLSASLSKHKWRLAVLLVVLGTGLALAVWLFSAQGTARTQHYQVVAQYPHDPYAYCQGLVFHDGFLYEGTGKYGESTLRKVDLETGRVLQQMDLNRRYFGEGIAIWKNKIIQLTWRERVAFIYDLASLQYAGRTFTYTGEGWGLTTDGRHLIMSDGTSVLRFLDPQTFEVKKRLVVKDGRRRIADLNELEYINGEIYANVWKQDYILRISPRTGDVLAWIDLHNLWRGRNDNEAVLNGIAYDAENRRLFVTGKNWPKLYEIKVR